MNYRWVCLLLIVLACAAHPSTVYAHAPLVPGDNESLSEAMHIPDPAKSWAIYDSLHDGQEAHYYQFSIAEGKRIYIALLVSPVSRDRGFTPNLALMGPGLDGKMPVPQYVQTPRGAGVLVAEGRVAAQATYEAFSPSSFYSGASMDLGAPTTGTYYIAVYEPNQGGQYGLAVGYVESFTVTEWILTPVSLLSIYRWEGQSLPLIFAPMITVVIIGVALYTQRVKSRRIHTELPTWTGLLAGLLFIGTGATVISQMAFALMRAPLGAEVSVTIVLAALPIVLGVATVRLASKIRDRSTWVRRSYFVLIAILALFLWSGYLIGPVLAAATGLLPARPEGSPRSWR